MQVTVRFFAAAKAIAGTGQETFSVPEGAGIRHIIEVVVERAQSSSAGALAASGTDPARVLGRCSFLLDGEPVEEDATLRNGAVLDVLPPFAGG